ncbi:acyl-CoA thioesterase [Psychromicrobium xiongbiense]|uniref:acyl-CoA thioesterase n=1 Tax=Psychromicrobium xiongbiense TaxID=3051184 RepID=UPI00255521ED|nr:acyl-CoA thioesterase [Psychromicrobium sp. YIM S02556]
MHLLLRTLFHLIFSATKEPLGLWERSTLRMRAWLTDIDVAGHINNGMYFSLMDLGRIDLLIRAGIWKPMRARGWMPVMSAETITFRKSVTLWTRFSLETRLLGFDGKAMIFEQCIVVDGEIYVRAHMAMRFVANRRPVDNEELAALIGDSPEGHQVPDWVGQWRSSTALPGARQPAPYSPAER